MSKQHDVQIRWMIRRDMPSVMAIENASFDYPNSEAEIIKLLRRRDCIGMVAEDANDLIVGFMIYSLNQRFILLESFAVNPVYRLSGVGRQMVDKLAGKLAFQRRNRIDLVVSETNLGALNFFKKLGFRATSIIDKPYQQHGCDYDGIAMQFKVRSEVMA